MPFWKICISEVLAPHNQVYFLHLPSTSTNSYPIKIKLVDPDKPQLEDRVEPEQDDEHGCHHSASAPLLGHVVQVIVIIPVIITILPVPETQKLFKGKIKKIWVNFNWVTTQEKLFCCYFCDEGCCSLYYRFCQTPDLVRRTRSWLYFCYGTRRTRTLTQIFRMGWY